MELYDRIKSVSPPCTKSLDFSLEIFVWITHTYLIGYILGRFRFLFLCFQGADIRWNMPLISTVSQSRILTCHAWTWHPCTTAIIWVMCTQWTSATTIWAAVHYLSFTLFSVARFVEVCYPEFCAFLILEVVGGEWLALCCDCFILKEKPLRSLLVGGWVTTGATIDMVAKGIIIPDLAMTWAMAVPLLTELIYFLILNLFNNGVLIAQDFVSRKLIGWLCTVEWKL